MRENSGRYCMHADQMEQMPEDDKLAILRAADELIGTGGRTLLAKILKGSREKKVLQLELDSCPVYGYFKGVKKEDVLLKIDWMINHDFLEIEYSGKLPMILYTDRGWKIESDQRADEWLDEWDHILNKNRPIPDMSYLKDRNRELVFLFLDKIMETGEKKYIPFLQAWQEIDYKKVKDRIQKIILALEEGVEINHESIQERKAPIKKALKGYTPRDIQTRRSEE